MISAPDWLVLTFAIIGIWTVASITLLALIVIIGTIFDLHFHPWQRRKQRRLVHDIETHLRKQDIP